MILQPNSGYLYNRPRFVEKPYSWVPHIPLAFYLIEVLKPKVFVELGTHSGNSYFSFCQAVKDLNIWTKCSAVDTWEGEHHSDLYGSEIFERVHLINSENFSGFSSLLKMRFDDALQEFADKSIDLLHIDGYHTYDAVKHDFETWLPKLSNECVVLFHDTDVKERNFGVWKLFDELGQKYPSYNFKYGYGLGLLCLGDNVNKGFKKFIEDAAKHETIELYFAALGERIQLLHENTDQLSELEKYRWLTQHTDDIDDQNLSVADKLRNVIRIQNQIISNADFKHADLLINIEDSIERKNIEINHLKSQILSKTVLLDNQKLESDKLNRSWQQWLIVILKKLSPGRLKFKLLLIRQTKIIKNCGLFDENFYLKNNPDVKQSSMPPIYHYLRYGGFEARNPGLGFDNAFYLSQNLDVAQSGINPLLHFALYGKSENRKPHADTIQKAIDGKVGSVSDPQKEVNIKQASMTTEDEIKMIAKSGLFDKAYYLANNPDLKSLTIDPLIHFYLNGGKEGRNPGREFDTHFYRSNYPIVEENKLNPLVHYLQFGKAQNWSINGKINKVKIQFNLKSTEGFKKDLLVIIPVFVRNEKSLLLLTELLQSLKKAYPKKNKLLSFIIVDDASPMQEMHSFYRKNKFFSRRDVKLIKNRHNLGYSASVNIGLKRRAEKSDILILNSDTQIFSDTFEILQDVALRNDRVASVTPFSNYATIASISNWPWGEGEIWGYDHSQIADKIKNLKLKTEMLGVPTGHGFCMYMTDKALIKVGDFNQAAFGHGYGEENDWCQRAIQQGFFNILSPEIYVYHFDTGSFSAKEKLALKSENSKKLSALHPLYNNSVMSYIKIDPLELQRVLIEIKLTEIHKEKKKLSSLAFFLHRDPYNYDGGTEVHVNELTQGLLKQLDKYEIFTFFPLTNQRKKLIGIRYSNSNNDCSFIKHIPTNQLETFLEYFSKRLDFIHIHHFLDWNHKVIDWLTTVKVKRKLATLHDYIPFCVDPSFKQKGLKLRTSLGQPDISNYGLPVESLEEYKNILGLFSDVDMLLLPSENCRNTIREFIQYYKIKNTALPHFLSYIGSQNQLSGKCDISRDKIIFLGHASKEKGVNLFLEASKELIKKGYKLEIWGTASVINTDIPIFPYRGSHDLIQRENRPFMVVMPSELPETFSLTLFEALFILNTPVIVGPFGNPAEFVQQYKVGQVMNSLTSGDLLDAVSAIEMNYNVYHKNIMDTITDIAGNYDMEQYLQKYIGILHTPPPLD